MSSNKSNGHLVLTEAEVKAWWDAMTPDGRLEKVIDLALRKSGEGKSDAWSKPWDGLETLQRWTLTNALAKMAASDRGN